MCLRGLPAQQGAKETLRAPASCQGSTVEPLPSRLWETYLPGLVEDWAWGLSQPRLRSRVSSVIPAEQRRGPSSTLPWSQLPSGPPTSPRPACSQRPAGGPEEQTPPEGAPGEEGPRRQTLPPRLPILKQTLGAGLGLSSGPLSYLSPEAAGWRNPAVYTKTWRPPPESASSHDRSARD